MSKIDEGLRIEDLKDLVRPKLSIDEYESKIDKDAIVVGFYVDDDAPAEDLSVFIEKGSSNILDTEVSPAPDDDGNYLVFVEFLRDEKFPEELEYVLESIEGLTGIQEWKFNAYGHQEEIFDMSTENLMEKIRLNQEEVEELTDEQLESIEFFKNSLLSDVEINGNNISLVRNQLTRIFEKIALGDSHLLDHTLKLTNKPVLMDRQSLRECNSLRSMLGKNWDVIKLDKHYILANNEDERIMVLK